MTTLPLALVFLLLEFVQALEYNVIVDDADPRITYTGSDWMTISENGGVPIHLNQSLLQDGTAHFVNGSDNSAGFNFTGLAVWVRGVLSISLWRDSRPPNVTFTLDGVEASLSSAISNDTHSLKYNVTFFQATALSDGPHVLSIRTHDSSLFILDSITYGTSSTFFTAVNSTDTTDSSSPRSTSTDDQSADIDSDSPHAVVIGGVVGGIFGAILLAGLVGLLIVHKSRKQTSGPRSSRTRRQNRGVAPGSGSGGSSGRRRQAERDRQMRKQDKVSIEFNYSGPKQVDIPWISPVKESEPPRREDRVSNYASSSASEVGKTTNLHYAITTDSLHLADPRTLEWGTRFKQEKDHSMQTDDSTLDAEGVLEHVMNHSPTAEFSTRSPTRVVEDHPFRTRPQA